MTTLKLKKCEGVVKKSLFAIINVLDQIKTQKIYQKLFQKIPECCNLFLIVTKLKKWVKKQLIIILMH